jgi:hypothetical protein
VLTVGGQRGQPVLSRHPFSIVTAAGRNNDQRLSVEVDQRRCLPHRHRRLPQLVEKALHIAGGGGAGTRFIPRLGRQAATVGLPTDQVRVTSRSSMNGVATTARDATSPVAKEPTTIRPILTLAGCWIGSSSRREPRFSVVMAVSRGRLPRPPCSPQRNALSWFSGGGIVTVGPE